jgi:hypothetical protein
MATDKQIAANRLNALKSTGPKTPEGRAAVRLNGLTHGLTAETLVLPGESQTDFQALLDSHEAEHQPSNPTEEALVLQLVMADWRLRRLYNHEAGFYLEGLKSLASVNKQDIHNQSSLLTGHLGAWDANAQASLHRQEVRLERTFYRAIHELQRLRKARPKDGPPALALVRRADPKQPIDHAESQVADPVLAQFPQQINDIPAAAPPQEPTPNAK